MVHGLDRVRYLRSNYAFYMRLEFVVVLGVLPPFFIPLIKVFQFYGQYGGLKRIQPAVIAFDFMAVFFLSPVVSEHTNLIGDALVICNYCAPVAIGAKVL